MQVRTVKAVTDLGALKGATGPRIVEGADGKTYVVKFAGRDRAAVNELIGQALARSVGLPAPESVFLELTPEFATLVPPVASGSVSPGLHHGSELLPGGMDMNQFARRQLNPGEFLLNPEAIPATVCHDNWVLTGDRDRDDNHLIYPFQGGFRYSMVDFSHSFTGPDWTADSVEQGAYLRLLMPVHPIVAELARGSEPFSSVLDRVEGYSDSDIHEVVSAVPERWGLSGEERSCLENFLEVRRGLVRSVLDRNSFAFPNWQRSTT
jgi:hypothetical protein